MLLPKYNIAHLCSNKEVGVDLLGKIYQLSLLG